MQKVENFNGSLILSKCNGWENNDGVETSKRKSQARLLIMKVLCSASLV